MRNQGDESFKGIQLYGLGFNGKHGFTE